MAMMHAAEALAAAQQDAGRRAMLAVDVKQLVGHQPAAGTVALPQGMILRYDGGEEAVLYDASWHMKGSFPVNAAVSRVAAGASTVRVGYRSSGEDPGLAIELRTLGPPRRVTARRKGPSATRGGAK